jgi:acetyl-CoA acetyltransferase
MPRDVAIVSYAQTKYSRRSGRSPYDFAAEVLEQIVERSGIDPKQIDGVALGPSFQALGTSFYSNFMVDYLGLSVSWLQTSDLGGATFLSLVDRASAAIRAGHCETVLVLGADAVMEEAERMLRRSGYRAEWQLVQGVPGTAGEFGLLLNRYLTVHELDPKALAKISIVQRAGAVDNEVAVEGLRKPLTEDDYFASRMIADPIRLLDCVMPCDGGAALLLMSTEAAKRSGFTKVVYPTAYAERTNFNPWDPLAEPLVTGFSDVGPRALTRAGLNASDIRMFYPYDDYTIAVVMQLEQIGFCKPGEGSRFVLQTDISRAGTLPINPGGGQLSTGQPGYVGGLVNLVEAVIQMLEEAGPRQVPNPNNALICGIGMIPLLRNFGTTNVLILER